MFVLTERTRDSLIATLLASEHGGDVIDRHLFLGYDPEILTRPHGQCIYQPVYRSRVLNSSGALRQDPKCFRRIRRRGLRMEGLCPRRWMVGCRS